MALKEISIRGDFRTTVEYLIKLLEHPTFESNEFTTSWLDKLIKIQSDEEATGSASDLIPAICGAVAKASTLFQNGAATFLSALQKGKAPSEDLFKTKFAVEFILNNIQYQMQVAITGPESFTVTIRDQSVDVTSKPLADFGLLLVFGGKSHVVYMKEETGSTSLVVDSSSFALEKDHDPSQLRTPSPGKLIRYMVKDGDHVNSGDVYAEVEVMKMYMPIITKAAGIFTSTKLISSTLSNGDVIGILKLDDPTSVRRALPFSGVIPEFEYQIVTKS